MVVGPEPIDSSRRDREDGRGKEPSLPSSNAQAVFLEECQVEIKGIPTTLVTDKPAWEIAQWLPRDLKAEEMVIFPDVCPGKAPLPTGTALGTTDPDWRKFAISDCGCGMQLLRSEMTLDDFCNARPKWDLLGERIRRNQGTLGDLGGGNHFLDALASYEDERIYFLVHTGSRLESGLVDGLIDQPEAFDREFQRIVKWARSNRDTISESIRAVFGRHVQPICDKPHNTVESLSDGSVIIRKGGRGG